MSWGKYLRLRLVCRLSCEEIACGLCRTGPWFESVGGVGDE